MLRTGTPEWIERRAGCVLTRNAVVVEAVDAAGIAGAVAYDDWTPSAATLHVAVERPMAVRALLGSLREFFKHRPIAFGVVPGDNARALTFDKHLGFREVARVADACGLGVDKVVLRLDREAFTHGR